MHVNASLIIFGPHFGILDIFCREDIQLLTRNPILMKNIKQSGKLPPNIYCLGHSLLLILLVCLQ